MVREDKARKKMAKRAGRVQWFSRKKDGEWGRRPFCYSTTATKLLLEEIKRINCGRHAEWNKESIKIVLENITYDDEAKYVCNAMLDDIKKKEKRGKK